MAELIPHGYREVGLNSFGKGLNLRDKVDSVDPAEAIDALNVVFTNRGAVEQRSGYAKFTVAALTNRADSMVAFYKTNGIRQILVGAGTRLEALGATDGTVHASVTGLAGGPYTFARFGAPNAEVAYVGNGTDTLRKWDDTTWTAPTATVDGTAALAMPKAGLITLMTTDNRLVATGFATTTGGPNGTTSSPSHVYFSNPGLPETWETDGLAGRGRNFTQLSPGDGEKITAAVAWRELIFIFKETKFFVLYLTDTNPDGTPNFKFRPVNNGQGCVSSRAVAVARDGVYFMSRRGVYRTTGGEPQLVSSLVDPIWLGNASSYFASGLLNHAEITDCAMAWHEERIYLSYPSSSATVPDRMLVYDTQLQWWSLFDIPASAMCALRVGDQASLMFGYASGTNDIGRHSAGLTNDAGVAITSRWRSNWSDYGIAAAKSIRSTVLSGTGQVVMDIAHDYRNSGQAATVVFNTQNVWGSGLITDWLWGSGTVTDTLWGPSNQVVARLSRKAVRGRMFSMRFSNNVLDRPWSINRAAPQIRERRTDSVVSTES